MGAVEERVAVITGGDIGLHSDNRFAEESSIGKPVCSKQ
jgi:hypothetical protein